MSGRTGLLSAGIGTSRASPRAGPVAPVRPLVIAALRDAHRHPLHGVDPIAAAVPDVARLERLRLAVLVGRAGAQRVLARLGGVPLVRPADPAVRAAGLVEARVGPCAAAGGAELDPPDRAAAGPGAPRDRRAAAGHVAQARE